NCGSQSKIRPTARGLRSTSSAARAWQRTAGLPGRSTPLRRLSASTRRGKSSTTKHSVSWSVSSAPVEEIRNASQIRCPAESRGRGPVGQARRYAKEQAQGRVEVDGFINERKRAREGGLDQTQG